ncbi:MAG: phosphate ABC transporter substrate-binding protein [Bryobacteraceae bacterium]
MLPAESLRRSRPMLACFLLVATSAACGTRLSRVQGVIRTAGSDTMVNVAQAWAEAYANVEPAVSIEVAGGGSATGIAALIDGAADFANCSRQVETGEIAAARQKTGLEPTEWIVGHDALAIYVHRDNPLNEISLEQLARIYRRGGDVTRWSQIGVRLPGSASDEIILISRQSNSGTYQYFRHAVLGPKEDLRPGTRDLNGSKEVVSLIGTTPGAIGYSGMGYATAEVKMLRVASSEGGPAYGPTLENATQGKYPIARPLYVYTLGEPRGAARSYLNWMLAAPGQRVVAASGYVPVARGEEVHGRSPGGAGIERQ